MEAPALYYYTLCAATLVVLLVSFFLRRHAFRKAKGKANLPPGPWKLPLLGNLHQVVGPVGAHRAMLELSRRHGPVMLLHLGEVPYVVVSSPEAAAEVTRTNDLLFARRPGSPTLDVACGGGLGVIFSPYGEHWRQIRKFCIVEMLSARQVKRLESIRDAEVTSLVRSITAAGTPVAVVNLTETMSALLNDIVARTVFGTGDDVLRYKAAYLRELDRVQTLVGGFSLVDLFPSSRLVRSLNTCERDTKRSFDRFERIMDDIIRERRVRRGKADADAGAGGEEDLLDVMLRLQKEKDAFSFPLTDQIIRVVISDIFRAAPDTTSTTIEWVMSELIKNPDVMAKARLEVDKVVGEGRTTVISADVYELHYLQMVIKEALRVHPAAPFLLRLSLQDCQIMGYDIPKGTKVMVNGYAIAMNKKLWREDAEEFKPERFQYDSTDYYKGTQYDFVPFGAGRRGCPGSLMASATMELTIASLLYHFDWALPNGASPATLDMKDTMGVTLHRASDLRLQATPRIHHAF